MTRYTPLWLQAGSYPAGTDRRLISAIWPAAVVSGCAVTFQSVMNVNVAAGWVVVPAANNTGSVLCVSDAVEVVGPLATLGSGTNRIDLIVCTAASTDLGSGSGDAFSFGVVAGTPSASPVAPTVPAGSVAIAQVLVIGGQASIQAGNITDRRMPGPTGPGGTVTGGLVSATDSNGEVWVAKAGVNGGAWRKARDVLRARWCRSANWSFSTLTNVPYDTKIYDAYGLFVGTAFTVPVSGMYLSTAAHLLTTGATIQSDIALAVNGASILQTKTLITVGYYGESQISDVSSYVAGDVVSIQLGAGVAVNLGGGAPYNETSFTYLGTG